MLETMRENARLFLFGTYPCNDTCYIAFCRTIIQCFAQIETLPPQRIRQQRVSNIALINTERTYADSVVNNDIDRINDIFHRRKACVSASYDPCFFSTVSRTFELARIF